MTANEFFEAPACALPKHRLNVPFSALLQQMIADYLHNVNLLLPGCALGSRIRANHNLIQTVGQDVQEAVRLYFGGRPARAYARIRVCMRRLQNVHNLVSVPIAPADMPPMYRMSDIPKSLLNRARIFHIPFESRHLANRNRYSIPGFPCLYLGGSLQICREECRVPFRKLNRIAISRFATRQDLRLLDFGYRPSTIARFALGRLLHPHPPNPALDDFIVNYASSWPLIAACSVKRDHEHPFIAEYVIPQLVLQWVMEEQDCDGVRYFSTHVRPVLPTPPLPTLAA